MTYPCGRLLAPPLLDCCMKCIIDGGFIQMTGRREGVHPNLTNPLEFPLYFTIYFSAIFMTILTENYYWLPSSLTNLSSDLNPKFLKVERSLRSCLLSDKKRCSVLRNMPGNTTTHKNIIFHKQNTTKPIILKLCLALIGLLTPGC